MDILNHAGAKRLRGNRGVRARGGIGSGFKRTCGLRMREACDVAGGRGRKDVKIGLLRRRLRIFSAVAAGRAIQGQRWRPGDRKAYASSSNYQVIWNQLVVEKTWLLGRRSRAERARCVQKWDWVPLADRLSANCLDPGWANRHDPVDPVKAWRAAR